MCRVEFTLPMPRNWAESVMNTLRATLPGWYVTYSNVGSDDTDQTPRMFEIAVNPDVDVPKDWYSQASCAIEGVLKMTYQSECREISFVLRRFEECAEVMVVWRRM